MKLQYRLETENVFPSPNLYTQPQAVGKGVSSDVYKVEKSVQEGGETKIYPLALALLRDRDKKKQMEFLDHAKSVIGLSENILFVPVQSCGYAQLDNNPEQAAMIMPYIGSDLWQLGMYLRNNPDFSQEKEKEKVKDILRTFAHRSYLNILVGISKREHGDLLPPNCEIEKVEISLSGPSPALETILTQLSTTHIKMADYQVPEGLRTRTITSDQRNTFLGFFHDQLEGQKQDVYCAGSIWLWLLSLAQKELSTKGGVSELTLLTSFTDEEYSEHFHSEDIEIVKKIVKISRQRPDQIQSPESVLGEVLSSLQALNKFAISEESHPGMVRYSVLRQSDDFYRAMLETELDLANNPEDREILSSQFDSYLALCHGYEREELKQRYNQIIARSLQGISKKMGEIISIDTDLNRQLVKVAAQLKAPQETLQQGNTQIQTVLGTLESKERELGEAYRNEEAELRAKYDRELERLSRSHGEGCSRLSGQRQELTDLQQGSKDALSFNTEGINVQEYVTAGAEIRDLETKRGGLEEQRTKLQEQQQELKRKEKEVKELEKTT